jgi:hypothetical protein
MYMNVSMWFAVLKYFPKFRKWATPVGLTIVCLALGLGSLSTSVNHLILTQGILFYLEEWWVRRRGFAFGVTMAGLGLSGAILPVVLEWLLHSYGFRTTLRVCALSFVVLNFPIILFFRPRLPLSQASQSRKFDMSFWTCSNFLILQSGNIIQSLGFFLPAIYLPTFARSLGAGSIESTVTIILLKFRGLLGHGICDRQIPRCSLCVCIGCRICRSRLPSLGLFDLISSTICLFYRIWCLFGVPVSRMERDSA